MLIGISKGSSYFRNFVRYHNGKKICPGPRHKIQVAGGGSHALLIQDVCTEDAGEYVAIARNCHGQAQSSAILDVTVPFMDKIKFDGSEDVTPYLTVRCNKKVY